MKMQNKWIALLGIAIVVGFVSPNISYGMEKPQDEQKREFFDYLFNRLPVEVQQKIMQDRQEAIKLQARQRREFFAYLNTLPPELQKRIQQLMVQDAIIFLTDPIDLNDKFFSVTAGEDVFVSGGLKDGTVKVWDIENGALWNTLSAEGLSGGIADVVINENLVAGISLADGWIRVWDMNTGQLAIQFTGAGLGGSMSTVAIGSDKIITGAVNGTINIINKADLKLLHTMKEGHTGQVNAILISNDKMVTAGNDGAKIWDMESSALRHTLELSESVYSVAIADDKIVIASSSGVSVWDINTGKFLRTLADEPVFSVSASGHLVAIVVGAGVQVWNINSGTLLDTLPTGWTSSVAIIGDKILTAHEFGATGKIWTLLPYKGTPQNNPLLWIIHNTNIMQLDFVKRAYEATIAGEELIIAMPEKLNVTKEDESREQRDGRIYFSFPDEVRQYLRDHFNIAR